MHKPPGFSHTEKEVIPMQQGNPQENHPQLPMGLSMALAKNPQALQRFSAMPPQAQQQVIDHTHSITSKREMEKYANQIAEGIID